MIINNNINVNYTQSIAINFNQYDVSYGQFLEKRDLILILKI